MNSHTNTPTIRHVNTPHIFSEYETPDSAYQKTPRMPPTPRTDLENRTCFIAFIENTSREVGAAVLRIQPPILDLYQFSDTALYSHSKHMIEVQRPTKIIIPGGTVSKSPLSQMLIDEDGYNFLDENKFNINNKNYGCDNNNKYKTRCNITEVARSKFSDAIGLVTLAELANSEIDDQLINRYLCLSAASACIHFSQTEYKIEIFPHTLQVAFQPLEGRLMVDPIALRQFSILSIPNKRQMIQLSTSKRKLCVPTLFNLLDRCFTPSGSRFLRSTLAAPPSQAEVIVSRQDFVREVAQSKELYEEMLSIFKNIIDLDPVITFLVTKGTTKIIGSTVAIDALQRLLANMEKVNNLKDVLGKMKCNLAQAMAKTIEKSEYFKINEIISEFLDPDPEMHNSKKSKNDEESRQIYAIKSGIIGILDMTRKCYEDTLAEIYSHAKNLSEKYDLKIHIKFNKTRRFFLQINKKQLETSNSQQSITSVKDVVEQMSKTPSGEYLVPPEMIHVVENATYVTGTTYDLLLLNKKNISSQEDSLSLAQRYIDGKIDEVRPYVREVYKVSEVIAFVDSLLSLSIVGRELANYNMPKISRSNPIYALRNARHPILERLIDTNLASTVSTLLGSTSNNNIKFVPNNLDLTTNKPVTILRGINMSGKTTYLQTAVQIAIMAQCGSFVPCETCVISPFTTVFTRSGTSDSIEGNASAFLVEMKEMNHITSHADSNSLIAIDEPCISTSVRDGIGLAFACIEKLIEARSFVLCATHFTELEVLSDIYPLVSLKEMKTRPKLLNIENNNNNNNDFVDSNDSNAVGYEFLYHIGEGSTNSSGYGVEIANEFYPKEMITYARECCEVMNRQNANKRNPRSTGKMATSAILQQLLSLKLSTLDDDNLRQCINSIKKKCHLKTTQNIE